MFFLLFAMGVEDSILKSDDESVVDEIFSFEVSVELVILLKYELFELILWSLVIFLRGVSNYAGEF